MTMASDSSASVPVCEADELTLLLEAARRATWDAKHGPIHLRSGRFFVAESLNAHASEGLSMETHKSSDDRAVTEIDHVAVAGRLTQR
jgi:hypothetical protein